MHFTASQAITVVLPDKPVAGSSCLLVERVTGIVGESDGVSGPRIGASTVFEMVELEGDHARRRGDGAAECLSIG
jgi:hypothetical protein